MLTGLKGVKYGLQPGAKQKAKPVLQKQVNVFGDDDEEGNIGKDIARHAAKKQADKKVTQMHAAALAEDASVFDYDGVYESIQEARVQPRQQEKLARKSRYIEGLLDKAKEREREQDIIYERTLLKERAAEDHLFGDKDKFVTAAYKKKLEEDQKWLAAERIREARDAKADVVKAGHMGNFYRNIMSGNVAFGTAAPSAAIPERPTADSEAPSEREAGSASAGDPAFEAARRAREAYEAAKDSGAAAVPAGSGAAAAAAPDQPSASARPRDGVGEQTRRGAESREPSGREKDSNAAANAPSRDVQGRDAAAASAPKDGRKKEDEAAAAAVPAAKAAVAPQTGEDKAAKAAAARERFLARKRKAPTAA